MNMKPIDGEIKPAQKGLFGWARFTDTGGVYVQGKRHHYGIGSAFGGFESSTSSLSSASDSAASILQYTAAAASTAL